MANKAELKETSERYVQRQVVTFLRQRRWFVQVFSGSIKSMPGLAGHPDIMATRMSKEGIAVILYVECKAKGGKLRPSQERWMKRANELLMCNNVLWHIAEATKFEEFVDWYKRGMG